jgi:putative ABC transport system permease protein
MYEKHYIIGSDRMVGHVSSFWKPIAGLSRKEDEGPYALRIYSNAVDLRLRQAMNTRWRKVWRDLWANKTRTLLVLLSIAVGVTAIGMVMGAQIIVDESLPAAYAAVNPASATIYSLATFDEDVVAAVEEMPEVGEAEGRRFTAVRFLTSDGEWRTIQLTAVPDFEDMQINKITAQEGEFPPPERALVFERASMTANLGLGDVAIGDTLIIEPPDGKQREIEVAGTVHDLSQLPAFMAGSAYGYLSYDTLEWLGEPRDFNTLIFVAAENQLDMQHVQEVGTLVRDRMERSRVSVAYVLIFPPGEHPAQNFLDAISLILGGMGLLSLALSSFLIVNILAAILAQQTRQIGMMKAVGAKTRQVTVMYFVLVLLFGILALLVAIPLGAVGATGLASVFAGLLNFDVGGFSLDPRVVLIQVFIGLTVPLIAAIYPIYHGTRVTVREAISEQGLGKGHFGSSPIDRLLMGLQNLSLLERPSQMSLRNTFRRKGRLVLTLITLSMATAIFIAILSIRASLLQTLDDALNLFDYDVQVVFDRSYRVDPLRRTATEVAGVEEVETWGFGTARRIRPDDTESDSIVVYAPEPDSKMVNPTLLEGRWLAEDDTNTIVLNTDVLRSEEDVGIGDTITLNIGGYENDWQVVGIIRGLLTGPNAFVTFDHFSRVTNDVGQAAVSLVRLHDRDPASQTAVGGALEDHYRISGYRVQQTQTIAQLRSMITTIFNVVIGFLLFMALLLGIVGGLGLMGTMSINVLERSREIGVMRAIGASDGAVLRIVLLEGVIIGLLSWVIGGFIALPASRLLTDAVGNALLQAAPSYVFAQTGALIWLVIVLILAAIASFLPAWRASRLTVREVLSYE